MQFAASSCKVFSIKCIYLCRLCDTHEWFTDFEKTESVSDLESYFTLELNSAIDRIFPTKMIKIHCTDKPWITQALKQLIVERQRAFHTGDQELLRHYRQKVRNEHSVRKRHVLC